MLSAEYGCEAYGYWGSTLNSFTLDNGGASRWISVLQFYCKFYSGIVRYLSGMATGGNGYSYVRECCTALLYIIAMSGVLHCTPTVYYSYVRSVALHSCCILWLCQGYCTALLLYIMAMSGSVALHSCCILWLCQGYCTALLLYIMAMSGVLHCTPAVYYGYVRGIALHSCCIL